jgi:dTDP-4-dehydrorhamnose reductase
VNILKILVLGATGMAGHVISIYLQEKGHDITTFSRKPFPYCENINGDIMDCSLLKEVLLQNYDVVINCIGVLNEECNQNISQAIYLNSYLPHAIVTLLSDTPTKFIHMSTDCVFSGKSAPYFENSLQDGSTYYDKTKALGEVRSYNHLTFRNSIVGPDMKKEGIGLFNWFMKQTGTIHGYTGAIWTGVTTLTLAKAMEKAATENVTGIYHLVNKTSISKFALLNLFNQYFKGNNLNILPSNTIKLDKTLQNTRHDFEFSVPSYEQMIIEMKEWINAHKHLYPHYT